MENLSITTKNSIWDFFLYSLWGIWSYAIYTNSNTIIMICASNVYMCISASEWNWLSNWLVTTMAERGQDELALQLQPSVSAKPLIGRWASNRIYIILYIVIYLSSKDECIIHVVYAVCPIYGNAMHELFYLYWNCLLCLQVDHSHSASSGHCTPQPSTNTGSGWAG